MWYHRIAVKLSVTHYLFALAGLAVVFLIGFAVWQAKAPSPYDDFAQCLTDQGVKMYGAWWCSHCADQKKLFGSAFERVTYVECSTGGTKSFNVPACQEVGIGETYGTPLWSFSDGTFLPGTRSLAELSEASGCSLPASSASAP
jgi:hypothetical protein